MDLSKTLRLGGQALPEGILIKGPKYTVVAYRNKLNGIDFVTLEWSFKSFDYLRKVPFIRGLITIFETFSLSIKSIFVMAEISDDEINIPPAIFETELTLPSSDFQKLIRDMTNIGENIEIKSVGNTLVLSCEGDFANQETILSETQNGLNFSMN